MVGQHCINYSVYIIAAHFGNSVAKVCECLIRRGSLSLLEIARFTEFPQRLVKYCLLVLVQHNCVQAFSVSNTAGIGEHTMIITLYMVIIDNIIHRMRFSKFCLIIEEHLDNQSAELLELFLQNGRLTFKSLYDQASKKSGGKAKINDVLVKFNKLVHAQYVERCPKAEPFIEPKSNDEVSSVKKRIKSCEPTRTIEQEAIIAAAPSDADKFSGIMDLVMNTEAYMKKVNNDTLQVSAEQKRKHEVLETDDAIQDIINKNEALWRVNYDKFVHCLKIKTCVTNVRSRLGFPAALVLEAMIESSDPKNVTMNYATSSMNNILESVKGKPGGISLTMEHVRAILEQLGCQLCPEESGALYTIGLNGIIETCQIDEIESLVLKKYGVEAHRVFRLLISTGRLIPMDQISDETFLEKKEAQKILCKLWKDGFLEMEKIDLTAGVKTQVFLWKVNKKIFWDDLLNEIFHITLNISQKISQVTEKCQVSHSPNSQNFQRQRLLECSLLRMDVPIMLFRNF